MQKETHRAHRKLARDTVDKRVRFRLYKSGRNWVIAGMTTLIFGIGIYSTPNLVKADTIDNSQTNGDESSIVNQSSVTLQTPPAATEESSVTEPAVADPAQTTDQTTSAAEQAAATTADQINTPQAPIQQPDTSAIQPAAPISAPENVSDNTALSAVADPAVSQTTPTTSEASGTATAVPAATNDSGTQVGDSAQQGIVDPASTDSNTGVADVVSNSTDPETAPIASLSVPFALADTVAAPAAGNVSAVTAQAIDVTDLFLHQSNPSNSWPGNSSENDADVNQVIWRIEKANPNTGALNAYYDVSTNTMKTTTGDVQPANAAELAFLKTLMSSGDVYDLAGKFHVTATNTRTIDGQVTLTKDSKVTISLDPGTLNLSGGTLMNPATLIFYGEHYSVSYNRWIVPITNGVATTVGYQDSTVVNDIQATRSANGGITFSNISVVHELYPVAVTGGTESYALYPELSVVIDAPANTGMSAYYYRYNVNLTSAASYVTLTPAVTQWDGTSTKMTGTGTGIGDTITIKSSDGTKTATTTVGAGGIWSLDLASAGFDTLDAIYVIESNALGDTPGAVAAPQLSLDQSHRIIDYRDAITGDSLNAVTADKTYVNQGTAETSQGTKTVTLPVNTAGNAVSGLIKDLSLAATTVNPSWVEDADTTFDAVSVDKLPVYDNYLLQTEDVPAFTVARNGTGTQLVYYYPRQITVDPNTEDQITGSIPPADENTQLSNEDPNSPLYPKGVSSDDLTKTITQTIHYVDGAGETVAPDSVAGLYYTRTATIELNDDGTTNVVYANWILKTITTNGVEAKAQAGDDGFVAVTSPQASNASGTLIPDQYQIAAISVTDAVQGNDGEAGNDYSNIEATVTYYPATITVSTPTANGDPVTSESDPRRYPEITATDLNKAVNETVHYVFVDENGQVTGPAADDHQATPISFARTASITYHYDDTGRLIADAPVFSSWTAGSNSDTFASVASPKIDGYTSTGDIDAVTVNGSSNDIEKTVAYFNNDNLTHDVTVTTNYLEPVNEQDSQTYHFYRQPTTTVAADGTITFELTAWTTNSDGVSQNIADQSVTLAAIDDSKNPNDQRWVPTTIVTVDGSVDPTVTDGAITFSGDTTTVVRDVAYTDTFMHIVYIDLDAGGIQIGETREEPAGTYSTRNSDFNVLGAAPKGNAYIYLIDPEGIVAEGGTFGSTGNGAMESFEGVAGQTYTIELRHVHVPSTLQTTRSIEYVYADQTEAEKTATQKANWTSDTDLAVYQSDKVNATTYHLDSGYPALDSPTITNFTPDILTVPVQAGVVDSKEVPQDTTVTVTYTQTTFTPDAPGSYGANLTYQAIRQINYVDGTTNQLIQAANPQTVTYQRNYVIDDLVNNVGHYTDWTTDNATFDKVINPEISNYVTNVADVVEETVPTPSADEQVTTPQPEVVVVKYYPTTVTVTADSPKDQGESTVPGDANSPQYPNDVAEADLNKTITRTIHYVNQSGDPSIVMPEDTIQTIKFTRDATITYSKDATGSFASNVKYSSWTAVDGETLVAVRTPDVSGLIASVYQVDAIEVPASTITDTTKSEYSETVNYYPEKVVINPGDSVTAGDSINADHPEDTDAPVYPATVTDADLHASVTQTIAYVDGSTGETISQATDHIDFERTATVTFTRDTNGQLVGTLSYDAWQNADDKTSFPEVATPERADQFADQLKIAATTVSASELDAATDPTGKVDVTALNDANSHTVTYWPNTVTVTPGASDAPDKSGTPSDSTNPDSPLLPAGVDYGDLHSIVTQIIAYVDSRDGTAVHEQSTATLTFERTAIVHYDQRDANGVPAVTYSEWAPVADGSDKFAASDNPSDVSGVDGVALQAATKQSVEQKVDLTQLMTEASTVNQTVNYYPTTLVVTPDAPHDSGTATGGEDSPLYPAGVDDDALHATVTEIIKYVDGSGKATAEMPEPYTTSKVYQRQATITYDADWQPSVSYSKWEVVSGDDVFAAVPSPDVPDMWADPATIAEQKVDVTQIPTTAIDNDGAELAFEVTYYPTTIIVDPHDPKTEGTPTQTDPESPKYPAGVDADALNTTVTQIIHYVDQRDGGTTTTPDHTATLNFVRMATITFAKDGTTQVEYSAWTPDLEKDATAEEISAASTFVAVDNPTLTTATSDKLSLIVGTSDATTAAQVVDIATVLANDQTILTTNVLYYPAVIIVEPDAPKNVGDVTIPGDANSPKYPAGVADADLTHQVTRVIQYINKQTGEVLGTESQTASATRSAAITYTTLDGAPTIVYSPWKINRELGSVISPEYPDLYEAISVVDAQNITPEDFDVSRNFDVVTVNYYPTTVTVTSDKPQDSGTPVVEGDDQGPKYPEGVSASDLTHDVVRQISYVDVQGKVLDTKAQTATYTRDAALVYTSVTEKPTITYSDWSGNFEFDSVVNPVIPGYYTLTKAIDKQVVTTDDVDTSHVFELSVKYYVSDVTVTADDPKDAGTPVIEGDDEGPKYPAGVAASDLNHTVVRKINYVDVQGKVLASEVQTLTFKRDANLVYDNDSATPTITYTDWAGDFELVGVANPPIPGYYTLSQDVEAQAVTVADVDASRVFEAEVKYYASTVTVTADDPKDAGTPVIDGDDEGPKYPEGVSASDLTHQVTRQIEYVDPQGNVLDMKAQTLNYTRDAVLVYSADAQTPTITYTDWQGNFEFAAVSNPIIPGFFTSSSDVAVQTVTQSDVDASRAFNETVKYYATEVKVTPEDPKDAGTPVIDGDDAGPKYPEGVSASDLTHQVVRQINYVDPQGNVLQTVKQSLAYKRDAVIDYGDGKTAPTVTYTDWTGDFEFDGVTNPSISGYFTLAKDVQIQNVTLNDVDDSRVFNETVTYYATEVTVTADDPKDAGAPVVEGDDQGPKYPEGVSVSDLNHTVMRQISYVDAQGKLLDSENQTLTFKRDATLVYTADSPTPTIIYTDWTGSFDFATVTTPAFAGYFTPTREVEAQTVTKDNVEANKVFELAVKYYVSEVTVTAEDPQDAGTPVIEGDDQGPKYPAGVSAADLNHTVVRQIQYVDVQGNVLDTKVQTLAYTRDALLVYSADSQTPTITYTDWAGAFEFEDVTNPLIQGFFTLSGSVGTQVVAKSDVDASRIFNETVTYYAKEITVTADDPKDVGTPVVDGDVAGPKYPEGVSASDLTHQVVRQITYVDPQGKVLTTTTQTLTFTRDAKLVYTSGSEAPTITYTDWRGDFEFAGVANPTFPGYYTRAKDVEAQNVAVSDIESNHVLSVTVKYYATEVKVTPDDPKDAGTSVVEGDDQAPKYPEGVSASDLNKTVTQTIKYVDQAGKPVAEAHIATVNFTRTATIVFGAQGNATVSYSAWTPVTSSTFAAVTSPVIDGMTTATKVVNAQVADPNTEDVFITVTYSAVAPTPQPTPNPPTPAPAPQVNTPQTVTPAPAANPGVKSNAKPQALPQMGDEQTPTASIIGVILATLMGIFGLAGKKRRKRQ